MRRTKEVLKIVLSTVIFIVSTLDELQVIETDYYVLTNIRIYETNQRGDKDLPIHRNIYHKLAGNKDEKG